MDLLNPFEAHRVALLLACMLVALVAAIVYDARTLPTQEPRVIRSHMYQYAVVAAFLASITLIFAYPLAQSECRLIPDTEMQAAIDKLDAAAAAAANK